MRICLVGYIDNSEENKMMLDTYDFRNDFWAERIAFRRKDRKPLKDGELKRVSDWVNREIVRKHRTNWLSERNPAYKDVTDPEVVKKYYPWMPDNEIRQQLEHEARMRDIVGLTPEEFRNQYFSEPVVHADGSKQLELEFE